MGGTANTTSKTTAELLVLGYRQSETEPSLSDTQTLVAQNSISCSASEPYSLPTKQEDVFYKINHIFVGRTVLASHASAYRKKFVGGGGG